MTLFCDRRGPSFLRVEAPRIEDKQVPGIRSIRLLGTSTKDIKPFFFPLGVGGKPVKLSTENPGTGSCFGSFHPVGTTNPRFWRDAKSRRVWKMYGESSHKAQSIQVNRNTKHHKNARMPNCMQKEVFKNHFRTTTP